MAGSSLVALRTCTTSFPDSSYAQLQLSVPPEATAACLVPPPRSRRQSCPRTCIVRSSAKPLLGKCVDKEESLHCGCKPCACVHFVHMATPLLEHYEGAFVMQNLYSFGRRKNCRRSVIVCTAANTVLDRCNDADDAVSSTKSQWTEEVFSSLQRSLLESQWALQSAQSNLCKVDETASLENVSARNSEESVNLCTHSQQLGSSVVRSGQASARRRRLTARSRAHAMGGNSGFDNCKALNVPVNKKRGKDQERGYTKQMRVCQSLEKAKRELKKKLGYDPSYELWAQSVSMSTAELLSMVREGEIARHKMVRCHLRLVVSVARAYENLGMDVADLILEGSKGLLRGLEKFDHRKGLKVSTYVHWWIRQGITRAIAEHSRLLRVPVYLHEIMVSVKVATNSLRVQGKPVTVENLSSMLNVSTERITRALRTSQAKTRIVSFDKSDDSYGLKMEYNGLHELVADPTGKNDPWSLCNEENLTGFVRDRLSLLTSREQAIIRWVFGIGTEEGARANMTCIAVKYGLSKERVRQIKGRALSKMRPKEGDGSAFLVDIGTQL
ncbi:hypothetical protein GOP47_0010516 [Adiantum capillus-veneris]|uniref:Sigma factor n=1 Tax=Adiantum capillus-veneris TaxID=13818 RepID=A0A9D4UVF5_ADICA|nr:hypothetical protein GOP47_0010516 [Adiantum capillus-veneris]